MILTGSTPRGAFGAGGRSEGANAARRDVPGLRGSAPRIVRKDGQKPFAQLKSLLQLVRSEEHTSELQSLMRISYAVFCLKKKRQPTEYTLQNTHNAYQMSTTPKPESN